MSASLTDRAQADLQFSRRMLQMMESGDAIVGSTPKSRATRAELATRIATLERLLGPSHIGKTKGAFQAITRAVAA